MDTLELLKRISTGEISPEEGLTRLSRVPYEEMGFAKLDLHRAVRTGFPETVFCEGKPDDYLLKICCRLADEYGELLGTRASSHQYEILKEQLPDIRYDEVSRIISIEKEDKKHIGLVAVCTGGTADIPVAEEAARVASYLGANVEKIYDIGVSGIHRLFNHLEVIQKASCVIAVAGMEGALASVIGGLVKNPVIAVPTAVGYGVSEGGYAALLAMLSSCANGIATVNIGNGYGAGYIAAQINRLACASSTNDKASDPKP